MVTNWYARTNVQGIGIEDHPYRSVGFIRPFVAWAHATTVTFVIGCAPVASLPLSDLLQRKPGMRAGFSGPSDAEIDELGARAYKTFHSRDTDFALDELGPSHQSAWRRVARLLRDEQPDPAIVPVRQVFSVRVESEPRATGALLEVMPTDIAPQALVWVHLEGTLLRDVA